ncbi:MAG TPA: (deoxy)nucleoside triphosphate pyrophosphohydrolase [Kribbella sp.]|uniref:(deoxy)nucleoside triphosphate pyrophosphohydrolase n=1 Tax=Kribbella sp. TaxID=1871183 RepID=UPI002D76B00F|nr:(deoxy)nucleoside triphosphate pyrophosphohydrolase [Kribbella sp.]HET6299405.1 (deoxy)nucleoside triphosphate pyrophosphohydrolase [Kribbella sp.]
MTDRQVVVGVAVVRDGKVLAALRSGDQGGWEFPGGKVEPGESEQAAGARELAEELGLRVRIGPVLGSGQPIGERYLLRVYVAQLTAGEPVLREHTEIRWVGAEELDQLAWLEPDRPFVHRLRELLADGEAISHDSATSGPAP